MNVSFTGVGAGQGINNFRAVKVSSNDDFSADKANKHIKNKDDKNNKDSKDNTAAVLSISNAASKDRSIEITKRFQSMKESIQKQIESLNERLQKASDMGNTELEEQLAEGIKELSSDFNALDEQLESALFEEQQRKAEEAKKKEEEDALKKEKEQEKYKSDEEKIKNADKKTYEFLAKSDIAKDNIQNSRLRKAALERTKGRLEGEMAIDAANTADREQRHRAGVSKANNDGRFSFIPHVSDKTILTEKKRIAGGNFTPDENSKIDELNKLSTGIENFENVISGEIASLNEETRQRAEDAKDIAKARRELRENQDDNGDLHRNPDAAGAKETS